MRRASPRPDGAVKPDVPRPPETNGCSGRVVQAVDGGLVLARHQVTPRAAPLASAAGRPHRGPTPCGSPTRKDRVSYANEGPDIRGGRRRPPPCLLAPAAWVRADHRRARAAAAGGRGHHRLLGRRLPPPRAYGVGGP